MIAKLMDWASHVSSTDPDAARRQKLLNVLLIGLGSLALVNLLVATGFRFVAGCDTVDLIHGMLVAIGGILIVYWINRYLSGSLAGFLFLLILTLVMAFSDAPRQVVEGRSLFHFTIPILVASFILRPWASFVMAGLTSAVVGAVALFYLEDYVPPIPSMVSFFAFAFVAWLSARIQKDALDSARQINRDAQREIAERKRVEAALKASEERYRTLIDVCPDSFVVTDLQGTYKMCNQQTVMLMEAESDEDLVGTTILERVVEPDRASVLTVMRETMEHGVVRNVEATLRTLRSHPFPAEINAALLRDADGTPSGFIGLTRDLTQRKKAEESLKRSNAELLVINAVHVAFNTHTDLTEGLSDVIDEVLDLLPSVGLWFHVFPSGDADHREIVVDRGIEGSGDNEWLQVRLNADVREREAPIAMARSDDTPIVLRDDELPPSCRAIGIPLKAQRGVIGVLGVRLIGDESEEAGAQDDGFRAVDLRFLRALSSQVALAIENARLTQEAAEAQALRELDRMRSELIANFSHDLKTPLGLIKMSCTTLMRDDADFDADLQMEVLQDIDAQADRLASIVDRVLELGQLESGQWKLSRGPVDLTDLIRATVSTVRKSLTDHHITCSLPRVPIDVYGDAKRVEQVVQNLLSNAVKYSPADTEITITGKREDGYALVTVKDQGIGIPEQDLERIFERFYRVDNVLTRQVSGTGLGLAVSRSIVRAHGGRIWAANNPDGGATLWFTIPLNREG
jgi:PAS domain S-box-containing protein